MNIEEATSKVNNRDAVVAIRAALVCTTMDDEYSVGFRNGLRFAISILTGEEPNYEEWNKGHGIE